LRYPNIISAKLLETYNTTKEINFLISAISEDIESIVDSEKIYDDYNSEELSEFLSSLDLISFKNILQFYINTPKLSKDVNFKCKKCNYSETITLSGLSDFFV
jgi:hypothetical protein